MLLFHLLHSLHRLVHGNRNRQPFVPPHYVVLQCYPLSCSHAVTDPLCCCKYQVSRFLRSYFLVAGHKIRVVKVIFFDGFSTLCSLFRLLKRKKKIVFYLSRLKNDNCSNTREKKSNTIIIFKNLNSNASIRREVKRISLSN